MKDLLFKFLLLIISCSVFLPLAYLGIFHGSSYGLELGLVLVIVCIILNVHIIKLEKGE